MSGRPVVFLALVGVALGLGASAAALHAGDRAAQPAAEASRRLYVKSGPAAQRMLLSFDALGADVYWIRAIQHYGRDRKSTRTAGRFELLFPLLDLTTMLDPHFNVAYRFGAVFLAEPPPSGPGRPDLAIALLQKGLAHDPARWQYALDIGFIHYWYGGGATEAAARFAAAADWFERAAATGNAPVWLRHLAATTRATGGDREGARILLEPLATSEQEWVRRAARRGLDQLTALDSIDRLQARLDAFVRLHQKPPSGWRDLDPDLPANAVPVDPTGEPYEYDRGAQRIVLSPKSPLAPLPQMPGAK